MFDLLCSELQVLISDRKTNEDLFFGLPGSFGSLAVCTRVRMLCLEASPMVQVHCLRHSNATDCVRFMGAVQDRTLKERADVDFMEGICYSPSLSVSISASFVAPSSPLSNTVKANCPVHRCNGWRGNKWFYNQILDLARGGVEGAAELPSILMPTKDYLFRHDQGSFWMASYRIPQWLGRLMGPLLDSSAMFYLANLLPFAFPKREIVLQDFMLPRENVATFIQGLDNLLGLYPLWLLPMKSRKVDGLIFGGPPTKSGQVCNVGAYGIPKKRYDFIPSNKILEALLFRHGGRKVYYSHAFYSREFFYDALHDGRRYFRLREKYNASSAFPEIYDKIITKNGKL